MKEAGKNSENISLEITEDGSHTMFSERFNQHYHNMRGAVTESRHLFLEQNGLAEALQKRDQINILEIGFGTGLNFLLLWDEYLRLKSKTKTTYCSIEAYPPSGKMTKKLNFGDYLNNPAIAKELPSVFDHLEKGLNEFTLNPKIKLSLFNGFLGDFTAMENQFDYIFHDAFSPSANPGLWTSVLFERLLQWCKPEALLTTYCAASQARGALASAGWKVARGEGAPGKREMTVASPNATLLNNFDRVNEKRLAMRYEQDDF
jgi:tRNA U34 5-methylaminomethyl-2-thiouridine-forming methyltransferase MnmC